MKIIETQTLTSFYEKDIWDLLVLADNEFVPSLSSRNSTLQTSFEETESPHQDKPVAYFEIIKQQNFILALKDDKVIGFLSYIPDYILPFSYMDEEIATQYVSTIIVAPQFRGQNITQMLYKKLIDEKSCIATRTWSTNNAHINILRKLKFELVKTLPNDRGRGIDTLYFLKKH